MWHTFKHFINMQYFLLPTNIVIVFVHWVSTVVCCTNPDNVHCFGTIFPNLNFVFASICAARPVHIQSDQYKSCSTVNKINNVTTRDRCSRHSSRWGATKNSAVALSSRNNMISIHPEEYADEWRQNNADLKLLENCVMNCFIIFGIMFMTATGLENSPVIWRLHCFTVSFRGDVRGESGPR